MKSAYAPRSRRARARLALAACVLWMAGFEVMPWLHESFHDSLPDHIHVGDTIVTVHFAGPTHVHADGSVHRGNDSPVKPRSHRGPRTTTIAEALGHGAGTLAHHGVAAIPAPTPLHEPLYVDRKRLELTTTAPDHLTCSAVPIAAARGPPSRSFC